MFLTCGVGEDSWESLGLQGNQTSSKGNQSWIFIGRTDSEAEAPILWPRDTKNWPIRKNPDPGKDWSQEEKGTTEDKMAGWHYWLDGDEFEWTPEVGDVIQSPYPLSSPFPPAFNLSQHLGLFQGVSSSHQVAQVLTASAPASVCPMNIQDWFSLGWTGLIS